MTYKTKHERSGKRIIEIRSMKKFRKEQYLCDLEKQNWTDINLSNDPNTMWSRWKSLLMECIDRHVSRMFASKTTLSSTSHKSP